MVRSIDNASLNSQAVSIVSRASSEEVVRNIYTAGQASISQSQGSTSASTDSIDFLWAVRISVPRNVRVERPSGVSTDMVDAFDHNCNKSLFVVPVKPESFSRSTTDDSLRINRQPSNDPQEAGNLLAWPVHVNDLGDTSQDGYIDTDATNDNYVARMCENMIERYAPTVLLDGGSRPTFYLPAPEHEDFKNALSIALLAFAHGETIPALEAKHSQVVSEMEKGICEGLNTMEGLRSDAEMLGQPLGTDLETILDTLPLSLMRLAAYQLHAIGEVKRGLEVQQPSGRATAPMRESVEHSDQRPQKRMRSDPADSRGEIVGSVESLPGSGFDRPDRELEQSTTFSVV